MFRIRRLAKVVAVPIALVLLTSAGVAQDKKKDDGNRRRQGQFRGPGGSRGTGKTTLLRAEAVRKELKISEEQSDKLRTIGEELRELGQKLNRESEKKVAGALTRKQSARLNEINLQVRGLRAVTDDDVAKELGLSDEQKKKIKGVFDAQQEKQRSVFSGFGGLRDLSKEEREKKFAEMREKGAALRKETQEKATAVLTEEQQGLYELMKGEKFELDLRQLVQRRGGQGGQGGRGKKKAE